MIDKCIIFVGFDNDYNKLEIEELSSAYPNSFSFSLPAYLRALLLRLPEYLAKMLLTALYNVWSLFLGNPKFDVAVFLDNRIYLPLLGAKSIGSCEVFYLYRNTIKGEKVKFNSEVNEYTFDVGDYKKYSNLYLYNQFCSGFRYLSSLSERSTSTYSFYFLGRNKGRESFVISLSSALNLNSLIIIPDGCAEGVVKNNISYLEHLKNILKSDVVLDIVQENQGSISMRTIEALVAKKKVITNCRAVFDMELYSEKNIYFLENESSIMPNDIRLFLDEPFDNSILEKLEDYSVTSVFSKTLFREVESNEKNNCN